MAFKATNRLLAFHMQLKLHSRGTVRILRAGLQSRGQLMPLFSEGRREGNRISRIVVEASLQFPVSPPYPTSQARPPYPVRHLCPVHRCDPVRGEDEWKREGKCGAPLRLCHVVAPPGLSAIAVHHPEDGLHFARRRHGRKVKWRRLLPSSGVWLAAPSLQ